MAKLVEKTYGDALFELSVESGKMDELYKEAVALQTIFKENEELVKLLNHPKVSKDEKLKVVEDVFKNRMSDDMTGFLTLLVKKDRQKFIEKILAYYIGEVKTYKKIGVATVTTAIELSASQKEAVEKKLIETTEFLSFETEFLVDKGLIGGMIIRVGDKVIDSSIKNKVEKLSRELYKIRLERW